MPSVRMGLIEDTTGPVFAVLTSGFAGELKAALDDTSKFAVHKVRQIAPIISGRLRANIKRRRDGANPFNWIIRAETSYAAYVEWGRDAFSVPYHGRYYMKRGMFEAHKYLGYRLRGVFSRASTEISALVGNAGPSMGIGED